MVSDAIVLPSAWEFDGDLLAQLGSEYLVSLLLFRAIWHMERVPLHESVRIPVNHDHQVSALT